MASTNQSPFYKKAEEKFLNAQTNEEKIFYLEEMMRECPKHKSSESMLANLKTRLIKLREKTEKSKKSGKSKKEFIRKADMQVILVGFTNSGKSSLLSSLTNAQLLVSPYQFTTQKPEVGTIEHEGVKIQIIDEPSLKSEKFDVGLVNTADVILLVVTSIQEIKGIDSFIAKAKGKKIIVFNKMDILDSNEKRKIQATLNSKKYNFVIVSAITREGLQELKEKIFKSFTIARIYLKEPGKEPSKIPLIMKPDATIREVVEKISRQMLPTIREVHIWGPSSKFPNQKVGLDHHIKDKDIVEFKTR
jgi:small GTP-binding protein